MNTETTIRFQVVCPNCGYKSRKYVDGQDAIAMLRKHEDKSGFMVYSYGSFNEGTRCPDLKMIEIENGKVGA